MTEISKPVPKAVDIKTKAEPTPATKAEPTPSPKELPFAKEVAALKGTTVRSVGIALVDPSTNAIYLSEGMEVTKPTHWLYDQIQADKVVIV